MTENLPTRGQLERTLSQRLLAFYRQQIGQQPSKVTCQFFAEKLAIILEDSITPAEQVLAQEGKKDLAEQVRNGLDEATRPLLKSLIEETIGIEVVDLLSDATLDTGRTGIIAIFETSPAVRNPESLGTTRSRDRSAR
ncbi:MAG: DUF2294 domain-containing protein [Chloroflexaceae bacterium]|nr:DUF2294 domain-containing protein [Chloroflexaceae bacterium]